MRTIKKVIKEVDNVALRDIICRGFYERATLPECPLPSLASKLIARSYRLSPDLECDICDALSSLAKDCGVRFYAGAYYVFNGTIWVTVDYDLISDAFRFFLSKIGIKLAERKRLSIFKNDFLLSIKVNAKLDPRFDIVAFANGVLDLKDYTFHEPDERFHVIYQNPYKFDPKATCPKWQKFLREVLPEANSRLILQMFLGLGLIERGTVFNPYEHKDSAKVELCLILIGSGANGKSVIYQTAMGLFGRDRVSGVDYDEITAGGDEGMRARRLLREAIFNWSSDSDANTFGRKRTGVFKKIVSGEPVSDRGIGENVSQNFNLPYLIFNLNELPYPNDTSLGFIRRLQFVSFDITIPPDKQNKNLAYELISEYPGIFNWVVRGAREIRRRKFIFPSSDGNRRQMLLAQLKMNPTLAWLNAYGVRAEPMARGELFTKMRSDDVIKSINQFCADNDVDDQTPQAIGRMLTKMRFRRKHTSWGKEYEVYGVTDNDIKKRFVIVNEDFEYGFKEEVSSILDKND